MWRPGLGLGDGEVSALYWLHRNTTRHRLRLLQQEWKVANVFFLAEGASLEHR